MRRWNLWMAALALSGLVCTACASGKADPGNTDAQTGQETESQQEKEEISGRTVDGGQPQITITEISYNKDTMTYHIGAEINQTEITVQDFHILGDERTELTPIESGYKIDWYGFYSDERKVKEPEIYKEEKTADHKEKDVYKNVVNVAAPAENEACKCLMAECKDAFIVTWITDRAVLVYPTKECRKKGERYNVIATDVDGTDYFVCQLPGLGDPGNSQGRKEPLDNESGDLKWLGGGYDSAQQLEPCGLRFIMKEDVELDRIVSVRVEIFS